MKKEVVYVEQTNDYIVNNHVMNKKTLTEKEVKELDKSAKKQQLILNENLTTGKLV